MKRALLIGLDDAQANEIRERVQMPVMAYYDLPRVVVEGRELLAERRNGPGYLPVSHVVFHGIYEHDAEFLAALALWGGPCLPGANALMDCRLRLPCLVRALRYTHYPVPRRGWVSPGAVYSPESDEEAANGWVAKWGNWHCGENKTRFAATWNGGLGTFGDGNVALGDGPQVGEGAIIEPFLPGEAIRAVWIGDRYFQLRLTGADWRKSIHGDGAHLMEPDPELADDARRVANGLGLSVIGNDYMVAEDGRKFLLEANHVPNVDQFPEVWEAYRTFVTAWLNG